MARANANRFERRDQQTGDLVFDELGQAAGIRSDDRGTADLRLEGGQAERFRARRHDQHVERSHDLGHVRASPDEVDAVAEQCARRRGAVDRRSPSDRFPPHRRRRVEPSAASPRRSVIASTTTCTPLRSSIRPAMPISGSGPTAGQLGAHQVVRRTRAEAIEIDSGMDHDARSLLFRATSAVARELAIVRSASRAADRRTRCPSPGRTMSTRSRTLGTAASD